LKFSEKRFEAFPDPLNNWVVWDRDESDFAEFEGDFLRCLPQFQAQALCSLLNQLLSNADRPA